MSALDDLLAKADEVLALDGPDTRPAYYALVRTAASDLALALKAVAEALEEVEACGGRTVWEGHLDEIRAAIERKLVKP